MKTVPSQFRIWLQLLRAPNLFTVPGDPVAGYLLSNAGFTDDSLILVALSSLCFYGAGLLMNDVVDLAEDKEERPSRPLPSGQASPKTVRRALWGLNILGLTLIACTASKAAFIAGALTVLAVWSYNHLTKRIAVVGALNMGLCRSLSVMTGALAGPSPSAAMLSLIFAVIIGLFIAAVTNLARFETKPNPPLFPRFLPIIPVMLGGLFGIQNALLSPDKYPAALFFGLTIVGAALLLRRLLSNPPSPIPPLIGAHIRLLLPLQASVCWFGAAQSIGPFFAGTLLFLWPVSKAVSKRFYAS